MTTTISATSPVGAVRTRVEGRAKVTGTARYAADVPFDDLVHGWAVMSTIPHGRVRAVRADSVESMPGVVGVLHHGNAPRLNRAAGWRAPDGTLYILQDNEVPHAGWPVALVLAQTLEQARAAAEALIVEYDKQPFDVTFSSDHPGLETPEGSHPGPPLSVEHGDVEEELAASAVLVDQMYTTPEEHHVAIEPHATTARWVDGRLEVVRIGREKGIDVRLALDVVRLARQNRFDVAVVFSQDQDLVEVALEIRAIAAADDRWIKIASAFPIGSGSKNSRGIDRTDWIPIPKPVYDASLDPMDYRRPR